MSNSATPEPGVDRALRSTTRNPRRRTRQSDPDSIKTAPRRKRSKIDENTFLPRRHEVEEDEIEGTIEVAHMNGSTQTPSPKRGRGRPRKEHAPVMELDMPMRVKKTSVKRPTKGDGATTLTQNGRYSVKMLPSTPKDLRRGGFEYRGSLGAGHHALAVTRERAYVWDYTSHGPVSNPKVFDIPFHVKATDSIPFGALVTSGSSPEIGLVLISAPTGKVVYYESIDRAASFGLFQDRNVGVEGTIGSLFSGENVTEIISARHAGFIVTLSSGRIAQLNLRDAQGKARVFSQFLRTTDQSSVGLFGSIKGFLGNGAWKRDVAAVHTRPLGTRGQMQVISLTEKAELQIWDLDWSGQYSFKSTFDFREVLVRELRKIESPELQGKEDTITTLDFAIQEPPSNSSAVVTIASELPLDILILTRVGTADHHEFVLAGLSIEGELVVVPQVSPLSSYHGNSQFSRQHKARLLLPKPKHTAIVAFEDAIVVKQLVDAEANSPEAQLHASYVQPVAFEDCIRIKQGAGFAILDAFEEDARSTQESAVAFAKGFGMVRVSVADPKNADVEESIPIKNKIEQAIFHGALQNDNIIDFSRTSDDTYPTNEVEDAVLLVSEEILRSSSHFISTTPTSMEQHFVYKAQALQALASYVRRTFPALSQATMWQLLWDAEKVAAAQQMWKTYEGHVAATSTVKRTATVLDEVCGKDGGFSNVYNPENKSTDNVRNFFVYELHRMGELLLQISQLLVVLEDEPETAPQTKIRVVMEADQLWQAALETVFAFRGEHASTYGILPELLEDGVLLDSAQWADLSEPWTCTSEMLKSSQKTAGFSRKFAKDEFEKIEDNDLVATLTPMIDRITNDNARLVQLLFYIYQERIGWLLSRTSQRDRDKGERLRENFENARHDEMRELADVGKAEHGMRLAEKYRDMRTLTEMVIGEVQYSVESMNEPGVDKVGLESYVEKMTQSISNYFERFGDDWANAYFDTGFSGGKAGIMLEDSQEKWPGPLTKYLRDDKSRAKICWIDDVTTNQDFGHASECLVLAAKDQETRLWAKKVELSLGKLSLLATQEGLDAKGTALTQNEFRDNIPQNELDVVAIQEQVYWHLIPEVLHCIDHQAEVEVAMQKFGGGLEQQHSLKQLLATYLDRLLNQEILSADEIIDVLTLLDNPDIEYEEHNLQGREFFLALKTLNAIATSIPQDRLETLLQLIWKRCYVLDDWVAINNRQKQSDEEMKEKLAGTAAWRTLYFAQDGGLFDRADSHVRFLSPSECLGAGCKPEDLNYRFSNPDLLDPILHDNRLQDEELQSYVTDRNLDQWIELCAREVKATLDQEAEEKAQSLEAERDFEASVQQYVNGNGTHTNGHVPNGVLKGQDDEDAVAGSDINEDVAMELVAY